MTTSLIVPNESSQLINLPSDLESWKERGAGLLRSLREVKNSFEMNRWAIGDWLVDGEDEFGEMAYSEAAQITGWERGSLYNIVWVVRKFPISLRSETGLKWSHFKELARIEDEKVRQELLRGFNNGFEQTVLNVRSRVDAVLKNLRKKRGSKKAKAQKILVYLQVSMEPDQRHRIKRLAKAKGETPDVFLRNIVLNYLGQGQKELPAKIQRSKNPRRSKKL